MYSNWKLVDPVPDIDDVDKEDITFVWISSSCDKKMREEKRYLDILVQNICWGTVHKIRSTCKSLKIIGENRMKVIDENCKI